MDSTSSSSTIPLISQVGGHAGVQSTQDGSLIIKPALGLEHQFYQSLTTSSSDEGLGRLRPFVPKFYGTLKLEGELVPDVNAGETKEAGEVKVKEVEGGQKENLVLENLSHPFSKPNILDIKLGTVLYDESAPPDKVERMLKTARQTTSLETGVRLTGFQVYDNSTSQAVNTPKSYGKSIKPSDLPDGIAKFFPIPSDTNTSGLPPRLLLPILENIKEDIQEIREAVAGIEMRMVGGSCLIIYEADWEKAEEGVDWLNETPNDEEEEEESEGEEEGKKKGPPYVVKLIDFAHTRFKSGEGPDEGVLKGLDTVLRLLDGRIGEVKKAL
ncbi:inositol polyphosphate multikinase [Moniliophthora roreri]|uniref:Kinase n=1 Tax=Moniliophthora roreri TaxID=221103 RepID=A0A0W0G454_MONRR|nr:inositol polyphosphate multikinase [Moniliophthora roreri]